MNEIERLLRDAPRPAVPAELNARMRRLLATADRPGGAVPWWAAAVACAVFAVAGFVVRGRVAPRPVTTVTERIYVFEPSPALRERLVVAPAQPAGWLREARVQVRVNDSL